MFNLDTFVVFAYVVAIAGALLAEFRPKWKASRHAAVLSIVFAVAGGLAWGYAVIRRGYIFSPGEQLTAARRDGGGTVSLWGGGGRGSGRSIMVERAGGSEAGVNQGGEALGASSASGNSVKVRGHAGEEGGLLAMLTGKPAQNGSGQHETEGDVLQDCDDCPEMLVVSGGITWMGAPDTDVEAAPAEKPRRIVRLWPGFAISREPISAARFDAAARTLELPLRDCGPKPAGLETAAAVCLTADDAEAYAAWLTRRSGLRFRLPKAVEWEFAANTRGSAKVAQTGTASDAATLTPLTDMGFTLSEMTADCFDAVLPSANNERYAWNVDPLLCETRVLKGAGPGEEARWRRPSARRAWEPARARWTVGFRVVRDRQ